MTSQKQEGGSAGEDTAPSAISFHLNLQPIGWQFKVGLPHSIHALTCQSSDTPEACFINFVDILILVKLPKVTITQNMRDSFAFLKAHT